MANAESAHAQTETTNHILTDLCMYTCSCSRRNRTQGHSAIISDLPQPPRKKLFQSGGKTQVGTFCNVCTFRSHYLDENQISS